MKKLHEYLTGDCRERIQDLVRERGNDADGAG